MVSRFHQLGEIFYIWGKRFSQSLLLEVHLRSNWVLDFHQFHPKLNFLVLLQNLYSSSFYFWPFDFLCLDQSLSIFCFVCFLAALLRCNTSLHLLLLLQICHLHRGIVATSYLFAHSPTGYFFERSQVHPTSSQAHSLDFQAVGQRGTCTIGSSLKFPCRYRECFVIHFVQLASVDKLLYGSTTLGFKSTALDKTSLQVGTFCSLAAFFLRTKRRF